MGYRLPLDSLPWVAEDDYRDDLTTRIRSRRTATAAAGADCCVEPRAFDVCQMATRRRRPPRCRRRADVDGSDRRRGVAPRSASSRATAGCTSSCRRSARPRGLPRSGRGDRGAPPATLQHARASSKATPPPDDPRLNHFKVTPDPGVIEVNMQPAAQLGRAGRTTRRRSTRRRGRRGSAPRSSCSTAATPAPAAAITSSLGGPTPADSPLLRRPDLLRSLVGYWHNHPSLSYLFSGMFIGPTSQHPRVDEARNDALYELEIAFDADRRTQRGAVRRGWSTACSATARSTSPATRTAPSSASTSSTRRTTSSGRRGLVELRAFEMPPHARMSLAQQLLLRALIARFWQDAVQRSRWCAGAPSCTIGSCCRTSSRRISTT